MPMMASSALSDSQDSGFHQPQPSLQALPVGSGGANDKQTIFLDGEFLPAVFRTHSYEIAKDACRFVSRGEDALPAPAHRCVIMRSLVADTIKDRTEMMADLVRALDVKNREQLSLIRNIADQMFDDEQVTWGRIVTLHAFCGCLTKYCESRNIPDCADDIGNILADFVVNRLGLWIVTHGGWKAFEAQFPAVCLWGGTAIWKGLVIIVLLIGAIFAFWSSVRFINP